MSDSKDNHEQEDITGNADFSTQSNESYHLSLALNSKLIEQEFCNSIIEGLIQQKRFKDVSYIKIKQNSVQLKAYDITTNQITFIVVRKQIDLENKENEIKKMKDLTENNPELFVQIINYWILIKDDISLLFLEMEYLIESLEDYLNKKTSSGIDIPFEDKLKYSQQVFKGVHEIELVQLNYKNYNISNYLMKKGIPRLSLVGNVFAQANTQTSIDYNENNMLKKKIIQLVDQETNSQSNVLCASLIVLLITNWLGFNDQKIKQIGVITLADQIRKGEIGDYLQIDKSPIFYSIYFSIINNFNQENSLQINRSTQYYIELLNKASTSNNQNLTKTVELTQSQKKQKDIYDDSEGEEEEDDEDDQKQNMGLYNKQSKMNLNILNPSMIINRYISSIQNCQQTSTQNQIQPKDERAELNSKEDAKQNEDYNIKREDEQIKNEKGQNLMQISEMKHLNQEEKVIVMEDIESTPANSKLFASQGVENQNHSKIISFSNKKDNEEVLDVTQYQNNNDIVLEMKGADISGPNSARQQKNLENSNVAQNPYTNYQKYLFDLNIQCDDLQEIFIMEYAEPTGCCLYSFSCVKPINYIRLKLFCALNPLLGKSLLDVIFMPFISLFNRPWVIKKNSNIGALILSHLFLWFLKILNIISMLVLVTLYLTILFIVLIFVHIIYYISLIVLAILMIPIGLIRVYVRLYYKLSDFKSSLIYQRQNSFTWFEDDYNYESAKEFKTFCHKMMFRRYQYLQSPSQNFENNNQQLM